MAGGTLVTNSYAPLTSANPLYLTPMYVRAGAVIPMRELEQFVGRLNPNPVTFNIYPGPNNSTVLYQDDGVSNRN